MSNALNWFEIPVTDLARAREFYAKVLQAELREESGTDVRSKA
jgi:predicted enzyme related to lactoylglutathione lyase